MMVSLIEWFAFGLGSLSKRLWEVADGMRFGRGAR
jgi:hypothetical protein